MTGIFGKVENCSGVEEGGLVLFPPGGSIGVVVGEAVERMGGIDSEDARGRSESEERFERGESAWRWGGDGAFVAVGQAEENADPSAADGFWGIAWGEVDDLDEHAMSVSGIGESGKSAESRVVIRDCVME